MIYLVLNYLRDLRRPQRDLLLDNLALSQQILVLVQPETVISWHRKSWRLFWRWKSKPKNYGRPNVPFEVIELIRRISLDNPLLGAPRIHGELIMLGYEVSESTVAKYMVKRKGGPLGIRERDARLSRN